MIKQNSNQLLSFYFVIIQFGAIGLIVLTGPIVPGTPVLIGVEISGIILGIWAILSMKLNNLSIMPSLKSGAQLVKKGPYRIIRHPMYLAILLFLASLLIDSYSIFRLIVFFAIFVDLILKLIYEERLLERHFKEYSDYKRKTYRLFPYIF